MMTTMTGTQITWEQLRHGSMNRRTDGRLVGLGVVHVVFYGNRAACGAGYCDEPSSSTDGPRCKRCLKKLSAYNGKPHGNFDHNL